MAVKQEPINPATLKRLGDVLRQNGQMFYNAARNPNNVHICRQILPACLSLQYYAIGVIDHCEFLPKLNISSLNELYHYMDTNPRCFPNLENAIFKTNHQYVLDTADKAKMSDHEAFVLAYTLRWTNGCTRRLEKKLNFTQSQNLAIYTHLILTALGLLARDSTDEIKQEMWELFE